jgi:hypothetical protein
MAPMMAHFCSTLFDRASAQLTWLWCIGAGAALLAYRRWRIALLAQRCCRRPIGPRHRPVLLPRCSIQTGESDCDARAPAQTARGAWIRPRSPAVDGLLQALNA